jgi:hypothetical protein
MADALLTASGFVSALLAVVLFVAWLRLIVRKKGEMGRMAPLQGPRWFIDIFRQALALIRRNCWILVIPLVGAFLQHADLSIAILRHLKRYSVTPSNVFAIQPQIIDPFGYAPIVWLPAPVSFLIHSVGTLGNATLYGLRSFPVTTIFLLSTGFLLLRHRPDIQNNIAGGSSAKPGRWLGTVAILVGFFLLLLQILFRTVGLGQDWRWIMHVSAYSYLPAIPFAYALLIPAMDFADQGQVRLFNAQLLVEEYFRPLFSFMLGVTAINMLELPLLWLSLSSGFTTAWFVPYYTITAIQPVIWALASFIPIIIVIRRTSFLSAFDECTKLWAVHGKNAAVLILLCMLLLVIPVSQIALSFGVIAPFPGWNKTASKFLFSLVYVTVGVVIMCSMVVFCRKVFEEEESNKQEAESS